MSTFENHLRELGATVITTSKVGCQWLQMMHKGEIDAFATEGRHAESMIREARETLRLPLVAVEHPLHTMGKGFAVPHSRPLLFDSIESALATLQAEGALEELVQRGVEQASLPTTASSEDAPLSHP